MKPFPLVTVVLAVFAAVSSLHPEAVRILEFDREAIARGEVWRLATGHFVHFGYEHLGWDLATFLGLGLVAERMMGSSTGDARRRLSVTLTIAALAISTAVFVAQPELARYRGLSGLDSTLFGWIAMDLARRAWRERHVATVVICTLAVASFGSKCAYELMTRSTLFVSDPTADFVPVPLAHVVGLAVGIAAACIRNVGPSLADEPGVANLPA